MSMFYAHVKQAGEGCDYTIGCGHKVVRLEAKTLLEAEREIMTNDEEGEGYGSAYYLTGDAELESVTILEVTHVHKVPLSVYRDNLQRREAAEAAAKKEAADLVEFERLQKKFGAKP
jgi:hypothetical protein